MSVDSGTAATSGFEELAAGVFYICRAGQAGRPSKYTFFSPHGAGKDVCPFFGLWFCGGFGDHVAKAMRVASRGWGEAFWEPDDSWCSARILLSQHRLLPSLKSESVKVLWEDGTQSNIPLQHVRGGRH